LEADPHRGFNGAWSSILAQLSRIDNEQQQPAVELQPFKGQKLWAACHRGFDRKWVTKNPMHKASSYEASAKSDNPRLNYYDATDFSHASYGQYCLIYFSELGVTELNQICTKHRTFIGSPKIRSVFRYVLF